MNRLTQGLTAIKRIADMPYQYNARTIVCQRDKVKLYHYQPKAKKLNPVPLLIVFATVNRPEILDLFPESSFIGGLLENGMDVYLLDWGYPDLKDVNLSFNDYVNDIDHWVKFISEKTENEKINLLGVCQGGLLCLCYAALSQQLKNLILISTPVHFHTRDNTISKLVRKLNVDAMKNITVSGAWLTQFFISLRPFELIGKKYLRFMDNFSNQEWTEKFLRVEKWLHDAPDQPGRAFSEFIKDFYQANKLIKGGIFLNEQKIDLANVTLPLLNVMAREDEIIPVSASRPMKKYVKSKDYSERIFPSGHIGIYISDKVGMRMSKTISSWVKRRDKIGNHPD